jgi:hypothetical protein
VLGTGFDFSKFFIPYGNNALLNTSYIVALLGIGMSRPISDDVWEERKERMIDWITTFDHTTVGWNSIECDRFYTIIDTLFEKGWTNPEHRIHYWKAIRACFWDIEEAPLSNYPQALSIKANMELNEWFIGFRQECIRVYEDNPRFASLVCRPHPKSKGLDENGLYCDAEHYATEMSRIVKARLKRAYRDYRHSVPRKTLYWTGEYEDGLPVIVTSDSFMEDE